jgi:hypothetical protein
MAGYAAVHQLLFPTHYRVEILPRVMAVLDGLRHAPLLQAAVVGLAIVGLAAAFVVLARGDGVAARGRIGRGALRLLAGVAFGLYAFAIVATSRPDAATNLAWLRLYVGWPLMALAAFGAVCWWRAARNPAHRFVLVLGMLATAQLFFYPPVGPQPLWAIRRMLRVVVPCMTIAAAVAPMSIPIGRWRRPLAVAAAIAVLSFGPRSAWSYRAPAYEHTLMHVRSIGALLPPGAGVLGDPAFFAESQLHIALWMTRGTPAFFVDRRDTEALRELRTALPNRPMFWIGPVGRMPTVRGPVRFTRIATYDFAVATRRMEPGDARDDLGLRPISLAVYRLDLDDAT